MSKSWGTPTWYFFHTLAEQANEDFFQSNRNIFFNIFKRICSCLPCDECTQHATQYIKRINFNAIQTKEDFKQMLFTFHNTVNARTGKPQFTNFDMYKSFRLKQTYIYFKQEYNRNRVNNRRFSDTMFRNILTKDIDKFLTENFHQFTWII